MKTCINKHQWEPGLFGNDLCPSCNRNPIKGLGRLIGYLIKAGLFLGAMLGLLAYFMVQNNKWIEFEQILKHGYSFPRFFDMGPIAYLAPPRVQLDAYYAFAGAQTVFSKPGQPVADADPIDAQTGLPAVLKPGQPFLLKHFQRYHGDYVLNVSAYVGETRKTFYLRQKSGWWNSIRGIDYDGLRMEIRKRKERDILKRMSPREVPLGKQAQALLNNPEWHSLGQRGSGNARHVLFIRKTDLPLWQALLADLHDESVTEMEILQLDPRYKRPVITVGTPN